MPANNELVASIRLALETQGLDAANVMSEAIRNLQRAQRELTDELERGTKAPEEYTKRFAALEAQIQKLKAAYNELGNEFDEAAALQRKLGEMEKQTSSATVDGQKAAAAARKDGTEAIVDHIAKVRQELQAEEDARVKVIEAMGQRARAYARAEEETDKLAAAQKREAAATEWMTRQTKELDDALAGMATHEQTAAASGSNLDDTLRKLAASEQTATGGLIGMVEAMRGIPTPVAMVEGAARAAGRGFTNYIDAAIGADDASIRAAMSAKKLGANQEDLNKNARQAGYGLLIFAHAAQDAQYGTAAVLNNIPLMVQALGGSAGLAGAVMIAAVAATVAAPHFESFGKKIGILRDPLRDATAGVEGLSERIKALEDKPFKVAADYTALRMMRQELKETQKAIQEWESLKEARTKEQQTAKGLIDEGITESGGAKNLEAAILASKKRDGSLNAGSELPGQISIEEEKVRDMEQKRKSAAKHLGETAAMPFEYLRDRARAKATELRTQMDDEAKQKIATTVYNAPKSGAARKTLADLYDKNKDIFAKHGVTEGFRSSLDEAAPEAIKHGQDVDHDEQAAWDTLQDSIGHMKKWRAGVKKAEGKAKTERDQAIRESAQSNKPGVDDELSDAMLGRGIRGQAPPQSAAQMMPHLVARLKAQNVPADIADAVAGEIMKDVTDKVSNRIREAMRLNGFTGEDASAYLRDLDRAKVVNAESQGLKNIDKAEGTMAAGGPQAAVEQQNAAKGAKAANAQANELRRTQMLMLRQAAMQETITGEFNGATQILGQLEAQHRRTQVNIRQAAGTMNQMRQRRPSLLPTYGGTGY